MGRPTEYKDEYVETVDAYLAECRDYEDQQLTGLSKKGTELYKHKLRVHLPTIEGFALFIGVSKRSLYDWEKDHPDFLHALDRIRAEQQTRLIDNGLSGDYNPTIAKLILSSNHGMRERSDVTTDDAPVQGVVILPAKNEDSLETPTETGGSAE